MENEYYDKFMNKLNEWIPRNCGSLEEAKNNIFAEKLRRVDWLDVLMKGLEITEIVVCIVFPEIAPVIAIANIFLSGGVKIYKKLQRGEPINWFEELLEAGVGTVLNLTKMKFVQKGLAKIGKIIPKGNLMKNIMNIGNKGIQFAQRIDKKLNKNLIGKIGKRIGEGIGEDIINRKDEYLSALGSIAGDLSNGEIPNEKIAKLIFEGTYNGCANATNNYIKEKMNKKYEKIINDDNKHEINAIKESVSSLFDFVRGTGDDILFKGKDFQYALLHNEYKLLTDPFHKWVDNKLEGKILTKHLTNGAIKSVDNMIVNLLSEKSHIFKINGKFNEKLFDDFVKDFEKNEKDELYKAAVEKLKKIKNDMKEK